MSAFGTKRTFNYCPAMSAFGGKVDIGCSVTATEKGTALIARIVFDIDICKELPETVPATGSRRKSRGHLRPRSEYIPPPCGIGSSSTRLRLALLRRTRVHHHKLG